MLLLFFYAVTLILALYMTIYRIHSQAHFSDVAIERPKQRKNVLNTVLIFTTEYSSDIHD